MMHFLSYKSLALHALLCQLVVRTANGHSDAVLLDILEDDADRFHPEVGITFKETGDDGGTCDYELVFSFAHDETLPVPTDPAQCMVPVIFASDGIPYLAGREHAFPLPKAVRKATGLNHISVDFNPCGHPPKDVFTVPHYDLHMYYDSVQERRTRTCTPLANAPVCDFLNPQTTASGRAFFNAPWDLISESVANMPAGFTCSANDGIPGSGGHCWNQGTQPSAVSPWLEPVTVMGFYNAGISFFEPMIPLSCVTGAEETSYTEELKYVSQTMTALPRKYTVAYDPASGRTTVVLEGTANYCKGKGKKGGSKTKKMTSGKKRMKRGDIKGRGH